MNALWDLAARRAALRARSPRLQHFLGQRPMRPGPVLGPALPRNGGNDLVTIPEINQPGFGRQAALQSFHRNGQQGLGRVSVPPLVR